MTEEDREKQRAKDFLENGVLGEQWTDEQRLKFIKERNEPTMTEEDICKLISDDELIICWKDKNFKITRHPPRKWKCERCGNRYNTPPFACECHSKTFTLTYTDLDDLTDFYEFNPEVFAMDIETLLLIKDKSTATELLTNTAKKKYPFYTTRHDDLAEVWTYEKGIYVPQGKTYIREFCRTILNSNYSDALATRVIAKIETDTYVDAQQFFNNNIVHEIVCENGILDLRTKELLPFNPKKIHFQKIPVNFDPKATCPVINSFFTEVLETIEDKQTMYELYGYCLWKDAFLEQAIMCLGTGRNGKDKTLELLKRFLGERNTKAIPLQKFEEDRFITSELLGKLANLAGDLSGKTLYHAGEFKAITGRSLLTAGRKFKEGVEFVSFAKNVFATNNLPKTNDTTNAFWERWVFFRFPFTFEPAEVIEAMRVEGKDVSKFKIRDPDIIKSLIKPEEMSGLLNAALDGLERVMKNKRFTCSKTAEEIKWIWIRESDSFLAFALQNLVQDPGGWVLKESVRREYQKFCRNHKIISEKDKHIQHVMQTQFGAGEARKAIDGSQEYVWEGVQLKDVLM